jgi:hypothetical protein
MFIAHAPSGYIMSKLILNKVRGIPVASSYVFWAGIVGAIVPDFDLAYFYLIDHLQTHHHKYITHWPLLWASLVILFSLSLSLCKQSKMLFLALIFSLGGMLHIVLDGFVGDVWLFAPFIDKPYSMFTVTARFQPWWLNYFLHISFVMELTITVLAVVLYRIRSNENVQMPHKGEMAGPERSCI